MKVGYVRVSTVDQNEERQIQSLTANGVSGEKLYIDKCSGKDTNRPQLNALLEFVREGDEIVIHDFSRLARSTKDLLEIVEDLEQRKIKLVSLKENLDTSTANGKLMLTMLGAINEFERSNMLERQREGIAIAKQNGVYKGRKQIDRPSNWDDVISRWKERKITGTKAMEELGLKKSTFYKLIKEL